MTKNPVFFFFFCTDVVGEETIQIELADISYGIMNYIPPCDRILSEFNEE